MFQYRKIIFKFLCMLLLVNAISIDKVYAQPANPIQPYQSIITDTNRKYGTNFSIKDTEKFQKNIINVMNPLEFQEMLTKDAEDFCADSKITVFNTDSDLRTSVSNIRYSVLINKGNKFGNLFATFEVVDLTTHKYFNKLIDAGSVETDNTWYFHPRYRETVSMNGGTAVIRYIGYWVYGPTGIMETTTDTYAVTFNV